MKLALLIAISSFMATPSFAKSQNVIQCELRSDNEEAVSYFGGDEFSSVLEVLLIKEPGQLSLYIPSNQETIQMKKFEFNHKIISGFDETGDYNLDLELERAVASYKGTIILEQDFPFEATCKGLSR